MKGEGRSPALPSLACPALICPSCFLLPLHLQREKERKRENERERERERERQGWERGERENASLCIALASLLALLCPAFLSPFFLDKRTGREGKREGETDERAGKGRGG